MLRIRRLSLKNCVWRTGVVLAGALTPCCRGGPSTGYRVLAPEKATAKLNFVMRSVR
jgi:hypothetical protein